jgi:hypothetical protein
VDDEQREEIRRFLFHSLRLALIWHRCIAQNLPIMAVISGNTLLFPLIAYPLSMPGRDRPLQDRPESPDALGMGIGAR